MGLLFAGLVGCGLALVATGLDWYGNPGGVFRDDAGTRWIVVWETFVSWAWPVALAAAGLAVPGCLVFAYRGGAGR